MTILLIIFGLLGCKKDQVNSNCSINYQIDNSTSYTLGHTWKFIGFQNEGSSTIDYPPCEGYDYYAQSNSDFEMTISFSDTLHHINDTIIYVFPKAFNGKATLNDYFGSYESDNSNKLTIGPIVASKMGGSKVLIDFEGRYLAALNHTERFVIQNNLLSIYYSQTEKLLFVFKK